MKAPGKVGKPGVNYYSLLGVPSTATQEEITRAFRKRILQVHLDKMGPGDDTELCYLTIEAHRILSDKALRATYDVERSSSKDYKNQQEEFHPAGYICYDVGRNQMSRQLLDSITSWTSEYDSCAVELCDNYFHCFSQIMTQVGCDNDSSSLKEQQNHHYCSVCDKKFITEAHHWDSVINPYRAMFFSDREGIPALASYFEGLIGTKLFNWEMRYLPGRLLGIWGSSEWSMLKMLQQDALNMLKKCDFQQDGSQQPSCSSHVESTSKDVISKLEACGDALSSKNNNESFVSAQNRFFKGSLIESLIWVLINRDETAEPIMNKMGELLMQDDIQQIVCLGVAVKSILEYESGEWEQLIQDALTQEQFELAMLWTMLAVEMGDKSRGDWFQLGMTIRGMGDAVLAHFCFLLAGCDSPGAYEELADIFTGNGAHFAAIEYHLNRGNLFQLLNKSKAFKRVDPEASKIYGGIFNSMRVKGLLEQLRKRSTQCSSETNEGYDAEIEELIEIIQDLEGNLLEGFRIIVSTWPDVFEEAPGHWIHRATIQFLRRGAVNLKSQKLILAAAHFLPEEERGDEISIVAKESSQLTRSMLERAQESNDFEMLTDVLIHLNKRTLATAEEYLQEIAPPPQPPLSPPVETDCADCDSETEDDDNEEDNDEDKEDEVTLKEEESQPERPSELDPAPQPPPPPPPGHKSAIILLLSGTIHKVKESWLDAMKDYQNALLSAPEVMHRVLPCVSKLVQDIQFHEAVVSQVNQEIQTLQGQLLKREYPDIDEFSSDKRRSLILTDVAPKMDYGYKDSVAKIQPDPDKIPAPPPPDEEMPDAPPPPPANTPMVTLDKNQEAIQTGTEDGQIDHLTAALSYVDLLKALPLQMHPGPIVMSASHFLRAMDDNANPDEIGKLYAYRNAIMLMAENLLRVDKKLQHTIHHGLTHKHMLSILLSAHEKLSKGLQSAKKKNCKNKDDGENDNDRVDDDGGADCERSLTSSPTSDGNGDDDIDKANNNEGKESEAPSRSRKDLIRQSEAHVISKFFQNVVNFPKVEPLASIPTLNCSDLVYVETLGNSFLSQFCADKVRQKHQSILIPKHMHAYTHFVEVWKGRSSLVDFPQARVKAMEELVALKGWTMGDVQKKMTWPFLTLSDGFSPPTQCLLQLRDTLRSYRTIEGFHIDYEAGTVNLLMGRDNLYPADTLFDLHDVRDVVSLAKAGLDRLVFSLEFPDGRELSSHPFKEGRIALTGSGGGKLAGQQQQQKLWSQIPEYVQSTLSRAAILLSYLASGIELSSDTPFWMRSTNDGLLYRLDDHLQHFARPIPWRKAERRGQNEKFPGIEPENMGKFWLNMIEVFEEIDEDEEECEGAILPIRQLTYRVGQVRTEIRPNTLVMTVDPKRNKQILSPEAEFARDLTRHFPEFSKAFPELQRLEELVKLCIVCSKLRQVLEENKALIHEFNLKNKSSHLATPCDDDNCKNLKAMSQVCSLIENFLTMQNPENEGGSRQSCCNWFPATFCHNMDPDVYDVTAGIELDPVVTYGPVPPHSNPISVPLQKIINLNEVGQAETPTAEDAHPDLETCEMESENQSELEELESDEDEEGDSEVEEEELSDDEISGEGALSMVPEVEEERYRSVVSSASASSSPEEESLENGEKIEEEEEEEEEEDEVEQDSIECDDDQSEVDGSDSVSASADALAEVDQEEENKTDDEYDDAVEENEMSVADDESVGGDEDVSVKVGSEDTQGLIEMVEEEEAEVPTLTLKFRKPSVTLNQIDSETTEKDNDDDNDDEFEENEDLEENQSEKVVEEQESEYDDDDEIHDENQKKTNYLEEDQRADSEAEADLKRNEQSDPEIPEGAYTEEEEEEDCSEYYDEEGNEEDQAPIDEADESCPEVNVQSEENSHADNENAQNGIGDESKSEGEDSEEEIKISNKDESSNSQKEKKRDSRGNGILTEGLHYRKKSDEPEDIKNCTLQLNLNGIEGKSIIRLRNTASESGDQALTKRAFLSRRSKVLEQIANARKENNNGTQKNDDSCSDDGDLTDNEILISK